MSRISTSIDNLFITCPSHPQSTVHGREYAIDVTPAAGGYVAGYAVIRQRRAHRYEVTIRATAATCRGTAAAARIMFGEDMEVGTFPTIGDAFMAASKAIAGVEATADAWRQRGQADRDRTKERREQRRALVEALSLILIPCGMTIRENNAGVIVGSVDTGEDLFWAGDLGRPADWRLLVYQVTQHACDAILRSNWDTPAWRQLANLMGAAGTEVEKAGLSFAAKPEGGAS